MRVIAAGSSRSGKPSFLRGASPVHAELWERWVNTEIVQAAKGGQIGVHSILSGL